MDTFSFETKVRVYRDKEVQVRLYWVPSHGLPEVEDGKKVVIFYPCDCGCWKEELTSKSVELINRQPNPERFVLVEIDPRYIVSKDTNFWFISDQPPKYTGTG